MKKIIAKKEVLISLLNNQYFFIAAIVLFEVFFRILIQSALYKHFVWFCEDSSYYNFLANNLDFASADRPSGFPFFLRFLFIFSTSPRLLIIISGVLGIATHILFFLTLKKFFLKRLYVPFLLSFLLYISPMMVFVNAMIYMPDTLSYFLVALSIYLVLSGIHRGPVNQSKASQYIKYGFVCILLGYLIIIKSVFLFFAPLVIAYIVFQVISIKGFNRKNILKQGLLALILMGIFAVIPFSYAYFFNEPRLGVAAVENFSGRTLLAHVAVFMNCNQLAAVASSEVERTKVLEYCSDSDLQKADYIPDNLLYNSESFTNRVERDLITGDQYDRNRAEGNLMFKRWFINTVMQYPYVLVEVIEKSLSDYINNPIARQMSFITTPHTGGGCSEFLTILYGITSNEYTDQWTVNKEYKLRALNAFEKMDSIWLGILHKFLLLCFFAIPFVIFFINKFRKELLLLFTVSLVYLFLIALGSQYDTRYYLLFDYLALVTVDIALAAIICRGEVDSPIEKVRCKSQPLP